MDEKYKAMLFGVAIFVGGMIAIIILKKFLQPPPVLEEKCGSIQNTTIITKPVREPSLDVFDLNVDVTDSLTDIYMNRPEYNLPWTSFDMDNNGPSPIYFSVNKWTSPQAPLNCGQSIHVDLKKHGGISRVYLKCDKGETTNVSFFIVK